MLEQQANLLRSFIEVCKANPNILHDPKLKFYKEYLESLGAKIPPPVKPETERSPEPEAKKHSPDPAPKQAEPEPEDDLPPLELDETDVIQPEEDEPLTMGDIDKDVSDDDLEKSNEHRDLAMSAFNEGDYQTAIENYTKAIELNPGSAILHAKRAAALIKLSKPVAAIRDCTKAIEINPDSAAPYKFRGRAYRLLGKWLESWKDLTTACKLDYDDTANEWLKEVESNAKKIQEYNRAKARRTEEKELRERQERIRRAQEANKRAAEEAAHAHAQGEEDEADFDLPGAGGPGGFDQFGALLNEIMADPEIKEAIQKDPSIITAMTEMMSNPASIMKHLSNPVLMKIMSKMGTKFGGGGGMPGFSFGGAGTDDPTSSAEPEPSTAPKKAPEPDLD